MTRTGYRLPPFSLLSIPLTVCTKYACYVYAFLLKGCCSFPLRYLCFRYTIPCASPSIQVLDHCTLLLSYVQNLTVLPIFLRFG